MKNGKITVDKTFFLSYSCLCIILLWEYWIIVYETNLTPKISNLGYNLSPFDKLKKNSVSLSKEHVTFYTLSPRFNNCSDSSFRQ